MEVTTVRKVVEVTDMPIRATNRRANRRVSVKSAIVGNHLYQTSNGWTWERLIEDGKALLAVDPDTDRIVSTDKKAEKAGGLILALLGQPVGPDDEVDVTKEYELIAPPSES